MYTACAVPIGTYESNTTMLICKVLDYRDTWHSFFIGCDNA